MISECNCTNAKSLYMLESGEPEPEKDGNCICTDCNCHYFRRNVDQLPDLNKDEWLQNKLRNYGMVILGTSTIFYGIYLFCCEKHLHYFVV